MTSKVKRPIVRYHGGKWKLAPWIISFFPYHSVYTEVFGGGGSVLLRKSRTYAEIYNDLDSEIVNLFKVMRDDGKKLKELLFLTPYSKEEFDLSYEKSEDPIEQARRTVVRNSFGFSSTAHNNKTGFKGNANKSGTTPAKVWANYPVFLDFAIERLRGVVIENSDAKKILKSHDQVNALHYIDPPYVFSTRDAGKDYRFEMEDEDHVELSELLKGLKGMIVLSGYDSEIYNDLYNGWTKHYYKTYANSNGERIETIWINEQCKERAIQKKLF